MDIARKVSISIDEWESVGLRGEHMIWVETDITNLILEMLGVDESAISPSAILVCDCIARKITVEECLDRIRDPV